MTKLEQSQVSVSTQVTKSVDIHCRISSSQFEPETIHWYLQKPNQTLEHLIQITSTRAPAQTKERVMAKKDASTVSSILTINRIQKEDEAVYYCAGWGAQCLDCAVEPHKILSLDLCPPTSFTTQVPTASSPAGLPDSGLTSQHPWAIQEAVMAGVVTPACDSRSSSDIIPY